MPLVTWLHSSVAPAWCSAMSAGAGFAGSRVRGAEIHHCNCLGLLGSRLHLAAQLCGTGVVQRHQQLRTQRAERGFPGADIQPLRIAVLNHAQLHHPSVHLCIATARFDLDKPATSSLQHLRSFQGVMLTNRSMPNICQSGCRDTYKLSTWNQGFTLEKICAAIPSSGTSEIPFLA